MPVVVQALFPVFVLIMLGHVLRRLNFPGGDFWPQAERFTYYILFPAMLVFKLGQASLPASAYADIALLIVVMLVAMSVVLVGIQRFCAGAGRCFLRCIRGLFALTPMWGWQRAACCLGMTGCR